MHAAAGQIPGCSVLHRRSKEIPVFLDAPRFKKDAHRGKAQLRVRVGA